jgi:hypothetical protein
MGGVKGTKTCIASEFPDALGTLGRLLSVLGCCGRARSGGGRCRRYSKNSITLEFTVSCTYILYSKQVYSTLSSQSVAHRARQ